MRRAWLPLLIVLPLGCRGTFDVTPYLVDDASGTTSVWGAGAGPAAESQRPVLDDPGIPADSPAHAEFDAFVAAETRKGVAWMAAGGVAAGVGVVGLALGVRQLVRAKRARAPVTVTTAFDRRGVWLGVRGQF